MWNFHLLGLPYWNPTSRNLILSGGLFLELVPLSMTGARDPWVGLACVQMLAHIFKFCSPVPQGSDQECAMCTS